MKPFTASSLLLGVIAATATSVLADRPIERNYHIINKASPTGQQLAITFNGQGNVLTVTPFTKADNQTWTLKNYDATTQTISPVPAPNLQAAWGNNVIDVRPAGAYAWRLTSNKDDDYTIQDGGATAFWGVADPKAGAQVTIGTGDGTAKQIWHVNPTCLNFGESCIDGYIPCCDAADGTKGVCVIQNEFDTYRYCGCRTDKTLCGPSKKYPCCPE